MSALVSKLPSEASTKTGLQHPRAFLVWSSKHFHIPPANQLKVFETHMVRQTTTMVPLSHTGFLYHFSHCSDLLLVKNQVKGGGFTLSCSLGRATVHYCWGRLASAVWGRDPLTTEVRKHASQISEVRLKAQDLSSVTLFLHQDPSSNGPTTFQNRVTSGGQVLKHTSLRRTFHIQTTTLLNSE